MMAKNRDLTEASAVWHGDMDFEGTASSGFSLTMDSAPEHGGQNRGFRPMELMLVSLAGCTAMDVISILKKKRQDVTALEVRVKARRANQHPRVYTEIEVDYLITGRGVDAAAVERAIELSETKYCPAQATLRHTANLRSTYRILEAT
jgi:putative redox protein